MDDPAAFSNGSLDDTKPADSPWIGRLRRLRRCRAGPRAGPTPAPSSKSPAAPV